MKTFDVQSIHLNTSASKAFAYIADATQLPQWTHAFASAGNGKAVLCTANGELDIALTVQASQEHGTIDWLMTFPDGSVGAAYSRVLALSADSCAYAFILTAPPVPLEMLEGALVAQSLTLAKELKTLQSLLDTHG